MRSRSTKKNNESKPTGSTFCVLQLARQQRLLRLRDWLDSDLLPHGRVGPPRDTLEDLFLDLAIVDSI